MVNFIVDWNDEITPNQSQISKLISLYQKFYYTEEFRASTHNIYMTVIISRLNASFRK